MSYTLTETGLVLTETQEGVTMPADYSFAAVNDFVHGMEVNYEDLECLALGMATEIERLREGLENCRLFAARHRKEDWALLILGFCAEAGVVGSVTR